MCSKARYLAALLAALTAFPAFAETPPKPVASLGDMPQHEIFAAAETEVPVRLKPGKYQVVQVNGEVANAVIDDRPDTVTSVIYGKNSVALFPHQQGAAHVTVTARDGRTVMSRYVIVMPPEQKYIKLHQACRKAGDAGCGMTKVYFCPNLCYETHIVEPKALAAQ